MFTTSAPVVGVHAPSGAPTAPRGPRPGRPAAPSDPRPEPTTTRQPAGSYNQPPPTPPQATGHQQTRLVGLGRSPGRTRRGLGGADAVERGDDQPVDDDPAGPSSLTLAGGRARR